jgi:hypothetical protein
MAYLQGASDRPAFYHTTITVGSEGDGYHDTFFPVWWYGAPSAWGHRRMIISRSYSATGPSVHGSHKAGLQFEWVCGNNDWGGAPHAFTVTHHSYNYRQTIAAAGGTAHNMKNYVMLRAGGYVYNITTEGFEPALYIGDHTANQETYSTPTSLSATTSATLATKVYE